MRLVKSPVDNQDVEKSYIGGHQGFHKGHKESAYNSSYTILKM